MGSAAFFAACSDVPLERLQRFRVQHERFRRSRGQHGRPFFLPFSQMGVATAPGSMMDTEMPQGASSSLSASVKASRANLEAPYAPEKVWRGAPLSTPC